MSHIQESPDTPSASPWETQLIKARKGSTKQGRAARKTKGDNETCWMNLNIDLPKQKVTMKHVEIHSTTLTLIKQTNWYTRCKK